MGVNLSSRSQILSTVTRVTFCRFIINLLLLFLIVIFKFSRRLITCVASITVF
jgi:hypothetical protein